MLDVRLATAAPEIDYIVVTAKRTSTNTVSRCCPYSLLPLCHDEIAERFYSAGAAAIRRESTLQSTDLPSPVFLIVALVCFDVTSEDGQPHPGSSINILQEIEMNDGATVLVSCHPSGLPSLASIHLSGCNLVTFLNRSITGILMYATRLCVA